MADKKKIGGILIESNTHHNKLGIVIGIGININEDENDIPKAINNHASSLYIYSGEEFSLSLILSNILNEFEKLYYSDWTQIKSLWEKYCIHNNKSVLFHDNEKKVVGKFLGITNLGYAKIQVDETIKTYSSGILTL